MRKFALAVAIHEPNNSGLDLLNRDARRAGEPEYPETTWNWIIRDEVPRVKSYGETFFEQHTAKPMSASEMRRQFPI